MNGEITAHARGTVTHPGEARGVTREQYINGMVDGMLVEAEAKIRRAVEVDDQIEYDLAHDSMQQQGDEFEWEDEGADGG